MFISLIFVAVFVQLICCDGINRCQDRPETVVKRSLQLPDLSQEYFQGDIMLTDDQKDSMGNRHMLRTGVKNVVLRWPKNEDELVIIPYTINAHTGYTAYEVDVIERAMESIGSVACIRFVPRTNEEDYIEFFSGGGCFSRLGKVGGKQSISIKRKQCVAVPKVIHEILHALGFTHMHNRIDRDKFIKIYPENLKYPSWVAHFDKIDTSYFEDYDTPYDLLSVMHYPKYAFAKSREHSILPCNSTYDNIIGYVPRMSQGDILRLNKMYECPNQT